MRPFCNHQDICRIDGIIESLLMQNIADGFFCLGVGDMYGKGFFFWVECLIDRQNGFRFVGKFGSGCPKNQSHHN